MKTGINHVSTGAGVRLSIVGTSWKRLVPLKDFMLSIHQPRNLEPSKLGKQRVPFLSLLCRTWKSRPPVAFLRAPFCPPRFSEGQQSTSNFPTQQIALHPHFRGKRLRPLHRANHRTLQGEAGRLVGGPRGAEQVPRRGPGVGDLGHLVHLKPALGMEGEQNPKF